MEASVGSLDLGLDRGTSYAIVAHAPFTGDTQKCAAPVPARRID
jgi:hypothetical protein